MAGNVLERVYKPADVWDITFCTRRCLGHHLLHPQILTVRLSENQHFH